MGNKISVIIPHYPFNDEINDTLKKCETSLSHYDELVLVVNDKIGFAKAVNYGLKLAKGDYLMVVNNDIVWRTGDLRELCIPNVVTSPTVNSKDQKFWGCFFCIPRNIYEKIGGLDEQFEIGYFEDDDFIKRLELAGVEMRCINSCDIVTRGSSTMEQFDTKTIVNINREKFNKKWNI